MRRSRARAVLTVLLLPGLVLAGAPLSVPGAGHRETTAKPLATPADSGPPAAPSAADVEALVKRYSQIDFDPATKAAQLADGPGPALEFVRDAIRFESYGGALRGASGAYATKAANAADRSLLLAALLATKKIPVRYAFGMLDPEAAARLADRVFAPNAAQTGPATQPAELSPFAARVAARAEHDFARISAALGDRMPSAALTRDDLIAEVRPHVWLQARVGDDWVDLDSSFADSVPGKRYCEPDHTADALPAEQYQHITLRLTVERLDGGRLVSSTVLEQTAPAADLADRQIFVLHQPASGLKGLGGAVGGHAADALVPVIWIDGKPTPGTPIDFASTANDKAAAAPKAGAVGDALSALSATPDDTPAAGSSAAPAQFVAEYLDTELTRPGGPAVKHRRVLIDRAGAAWRAAATPDAAALRPLARNANGPIDAQTIHNLQISTGGHDMWSYAGAMQSLAAGDGPTDQSTDFGDQAWPIAMQNLATMMWADGVLVPAMNRDGPARFYCDAPRLVLFSLSAQGTGAETQLATQIDLMHDTVRGVARDGATASAAVRGKVWYGVAEGALEHEMTAEQAYALGATPTVESTSALAGDHALSLVDAARSGDMAAAPADTRARIRVAAARGDTLVVPAVVMQGGESGWWAVSPAGDTRAVLGDDYGTGRALYRGAPGATAAARA